MQLPEISKKLKRNLKKEEIEMEKVENATKYIGVNVDKNVVRKLRVLAAMQDKKLSEIVRVILTDYVKKHSA